MNSRQVTVLALCSSLLFVGCGKTSPNTLQPQQTPDQSSKTNTPIEACQILTREIATAVLGETVPPAESKTIHSEEFGSTVTSCSYTTEGKDPTKLRTISILIRYAKDEAESKKIFADAKDQSKSIAGANPEDLNGIADEAYWSGGNLNQLNVRQGKGWFILSSYFRSGDQKTLALEMAKKIFTK